MLWFGGSTFKSSEVIMILFKRYRFFYFFSFDINDMFYGCSSLSTLNLSNFNDNDVKNTKEILNNLNSKCIIITKNNEMLRPFKK